MNFLRRLDRRTLNRFNIADNVTEPQVPVTDEAALTHEHSEAVPASEPARENPPEHLGELPGSPPAVGGSVMWVTQTRISPSM